MNNILEPIKIKEKRGCTLLLAGNIKGHFDGKTRKSLAEALIWGKENRDK
jgi:hypothetical protein